MKYLTVLVLSEKYEESELSYIEGGEVAILLKDVKWAAILPDLPTVKQLIDTPSTVVYHLTKWRARMFTLLDRIENEILTQTDYTELDRKLILSSRLVYTLVQIAEALEEKSNKATTADGAT